MSRTEVARERVGDVDVTYRRAGAGPPLVLVHGLGQDHDMWRLQQDHLDDVTTIAYDLRGHGGTTLGDADGSLAQLGGDLIGMLERFGPAACAGFSLGGTVVAWAAAQRPDLVRGVALIATSSVVGRVAAQGLADRVALFEAGGAARVREAVRQDTVAQLANPDLDVEALVDARVRAIGDRRGYVNGARAMAALRAAPLNATLARIEQPVLLVGGERDVVCPPRAAEIMLEHLPEASYTELAGVGHLVTDDAPQAVTAVLRDWMTGKRTRD